MEFSAQKSKNRQIFLLYSSHNKTAHMCNLIDLESESEKTE